MQSVAADPDWQTAAERLERSKRYPDVALIVGQKREGSARGRQTIVGLSVPLLDRKQGAISEAERRIDKSRAEVALQQQRLHAEAAQTAVRLSAALEQERVIREDVLPSSQSAFAAVRTCFEARKFNFLDVLDAPRFLFQAEMQHARDLGRFPGRYRSGRAHRAGRRGHPNFISAERQMNKHQTITIPAMVAAALLFGGGLLRDRFAPAAKAGEQHGEHAGGIEAGARVRKRARAWRGSVRQGRALLRCPDCGRRRRRARGRAGTIPSSACRGETKFNEDLTAHVTPRVEGIVEQVVVSVGQQVAKGDLLAVVASAAISEAPSTLAAAIQRAQLASTIDLDEKKLWEDKISARQDYLKAQQEWAGSADRGAECAPAADRALESRRQKQT